MARSKEQIISEMVDAGFSDDEIRAAFTKKAPESPPPDGRSRGGASSASAGMLPAPGMAPVGAIPPIPKPNPESFEVPGATPSAVNAPAGKPSFTMPSPDLLKPRPNPTISDIPVNAVKDVGSMAVGLPILAGLLLKKNVTLPSDVVSSLLEISQGKSLNETQLGQDLSAFIDTQKETVKGIGREVAHPLESLKERPVSTVADFLTLLSGAGVVAKAARKPTGSVGTRLMSATLGPSVENIDTRLGRNAAIRGADDVSEIADDLPKRLNVLEGKLKEADKQAWKTLNKSNDPLDGAFPKTELIQSLREVLRDARQTGGGAIGQAQKQAIRAINEIINDISKVGEKIGGKLTSEQGVKSSVKKKDFVSEARMREVIQALRENVRYNDESASLANDALMEGAARLDQILKSQNTNYRSQMEPVAMMTELLEKAKRDFGIKTEINKGMVRTDATVAKLKSIPTDRKDVARATLKELGGKTGRNIVQDVEDAAAARAFEGGQTQGSRKVNLGAVVGTGVGSAAGFMLGRDMGSSALGAILGQIFGALVGAHLDKEGGRIAGQIIDWYVRNKPEMLTQVLSEYTTKTKNASAAVSGARILSDAGLESAKRLVFQ